MSSISSLFGQSDGAIQRKMDFDDSDVEAAALIFNSPEGKLSKSNYHTEDVDMEVDDRSASSTYNQFQLSKQPGIRRSLSLEMRRKMMDNDMTSSPSVLQRPRKLIHDFKKDDKIEEEHHQQGRKEDDRIKSAVDRLSDGIELIADCSRAYSLPSVNGKHKDLKSISPHTLCNLLNGDYPSLSNSFMVLDCRYPYEYIGGHIKDADNIFTKEAVDQLLQKVANERPKVLIFHCEFSSQRAPNLLRYLRSQDRLANSNNYPALYYPEVYILDGGYKAFYEQTEGFCQPPSYTPMLHQDHSAELRHFRVKSKSWTAGEKAKPILMSRPRPIRF